MPRRQRKRQTFTRSGLRLIRSSPKHDYSRCSSITLQGSRCKMPIVMNGKCIYHQFKKRSSRRGSHQTKLRNFR